MKKLAVIAYSILTIILSDVTAELPRYKIIDISVSSFESCWPIAINENCQILGSLSENNQLHYFLWDTERGLNILDLPQDAECAYLNNLGQVAGTFANGIHAFIWDPVTGTQDIGKLNDLRIVVYGFNDLSEMLLSTQNKDGKLGDVFFRDKTSIININQFVSDFNPNWTFSGGSSQASFYGNKKSIILNNMGAIILLGDVVQKDGKYKKDILRIKNNIITAANLFGKEPVCLYDYDINENLIYDSNKGRFFTNFESHITAQCPYLATKIINSTPHSVNHLSPTLHQTINGEYYYKNGANILPLLNIQLPFWEDNRKNILIADKNSTGSFVGSMRTVYENDAIFLAKPVE